MESQAAGPGRGRTLLLVAAAIAALLVVVLVWALLPRDQDAVVSDPPPTGTPSTGAATASPTGSPSGSGTGSPTPDPASTPTTSATATPATPGPSGPVTPPATDGEVVAQEVEGVTPETEDTVPTVERLVAETAESVATITPEGEDPLNLEELEAVATGAMLEELQASAEEFRTNGWYQEGVPTIVRLEVGGLSGDSTSVEVGACLDNSAVKVVDEGGNDVLADQTQRRSLNVYQLEREDPDAPWKVASRTFPDDADC